MLGSGSLSYTEPKGPINAELNLLIKKAANNTWKLSVLDGNKKDELFSM